MGESRLRLNPRRTLDVRVERGLKGPSSCSWVQWIAEVDEQHVACNLRRIAGQTGCGSSDASCRRERVCGSGPRRLNRGIRTLCAQSQRQPGMSQSLVGGRCFDRQETAALARSSGLRSRRLDHATARSNDFRCDMKHLWSSRSTPSTPTTPRGGVGKPMSDEAMADCAAPTVQSLEVGDAACGWPTLSSQPFRSSYKRAVEGGLSWR